MPQLHCIFSLAAVLLALFASLGQVSTAQDAVDLPALALAAQGGHAPLTDERFAPVRAELTQAVQHLEQQLGVDNSFAQAWKKYLRWQQLEPHLLNDAAISGQTLRELDQVLRRFRANQPGLELPAFTQTADALQRYRELAFWYALAQRRDTGPTYDAYLQELSKHLTRNLEHPTDESARQIGKLVNVIDHLGQATELVSQVRSQFNHPNLWAEASTDALRRLAERPVNDTQPVRDVILGASVRGTAISAGTLSLTTHTDDKQVAVELQLTGTIQSQTNSYKKPVCVSSNGCTSFCATKQLLIADERFLALPAVASANTTTRTCSITKTGGNLGRRLIEKIARKKVAESKAQAEYVSARHAERQVAEKFDRQVAEALQKSRSDYEEKFHAPLTRTGMFPSHLSMTSSSEGIQVATTLASKQQISTQLPPPTIDADCDVSLRVHESAVNNFFPQLLAGALIKQDQQSEPPRLEGDVPGWLKKLATDPKVKEQFDATAGQSADEKPTDVAEPSEFKPWSFLLNGEHPLSLSFHEQKITVRIRVAELTTIENDEPSVRRNWDFLVTYRLAAENNQVVLRREGDIEALPTGFDPTWFGDARWDDKLTAQQVGVRKNLEENINKRVAEGGGFPLEVALPELKIPTASGAKHTLQLKHLDCHNGWLALGYSLP